MRLLLSGVLASGAFLAAIGSTQAAKLDSGVGPPTAAVLGVRGEGLDPKRAAALAQMLANELARTQRFRVLTQTDIASLVDLQVQKQILGCESDDCATAWRDVSAALDVERVL